MKRRVMFLAAIAGLVGLGLTAWTFASRAAYESAEYQVIESDGSIEIREYPELTLVSTETKIDAQGRDGSFMRLFRYISGANEQRQKIAMTTPVFMEGQVGTAAVKMGFVMPKAVAAKGAPEPEGKGITVRKRPSGRYAVIRFSGRLSSQTAKVNETTLREWMRSRGLEGNGEAESAGYDPPFTPGPLRRNEVLIRLKGQSDDIVSASNTDTDS